MIAGVAGLVAAVLLDRVADAAMPMASAGGLVIVVAGLCAVRFLLPAADGPTLVIPFALLAIGAAVALTSALRPSAAGTALFALSLFFPGVLAGFLLGSGVQFMHLEEASSPRELVDAFVSAMHWWALVGGILVVAVIVLGAILTRRSGEAEPAGNAVQGAEKAVNGGAAAETAEGVAAQAGAVEAEVAEPASGSDRAARSASGSGSAVTSGSASGAGSGSSPTRWWRPGPVRRRSPTWRSSPM
nr:hypothetical protein GCM10020093_047570 [Planobispora longispora]